MVKDYGNIKNYVDKSKYWNSVPNLQNKVELIRALFLVYFKKLRLRFSSLNNFFRLITSTNIKARRIFCLFAVCFRS